MSQAAPRKNPEQAAPREIKKIKKIKKILQIKVQTNTNHQKKPSGWGRKNVSRGDEHERRTTAKPCKREKSRKKENATHPETIQQKQPTTHTEKILKIQKSRES